MHGSAEPANPNGDACIPGVATFATKPSFNTASAPTDVSIRDESHAPTRREHKSSSPAHCECAHDGNAPREFCCMSSLADYITFKISIFEIAKSRGLSKIGFPEIH